MECVVTGKANKVTTIIYCCCSQVGHNKLVDLALFPEFYLGCTTEEDTWFQLWYHMLGNWTLANF